MEMRSLTENIESLRKEKGFTQSYMAEKLGITQSSYSAYITKNPDLKYSVINKMADILSVSVIDLITYPDVFVSIKNSNVECEQCKQKDAIIKNLNNYIDVLEDKLKACKTL